MRATFAVVGVVLYVVLRLAYSAFYGALGLSPDELGIGYLELLAQSAIGACVVLTLWGLLLGTLAAAGVGMINLRLDRLDVRSTAVAALTSALLALALLTGRGIIRDAATVIAGVLLLALAVSGVGRIRVTLREDPRWRWALTAVIVAVLVVGGKNLVNEAAGDARYVRHGLSRHPTLLGIPVISWGAEAATLSWISTAVTSELRPLAQRCVMFLGQSDGTLFIYSPSAPGPATFRVPASMAAVRIVAHARCVANSRTPTPFPEGR